jgi:16S rRNA (guanine966-N2)-methyltransferase
MRIVAGRLKGRTLATPGGRAIRPTAERLRESVFNVLAHGLARHGVPFRMEGCRVLDLFAGTGALGIEALSRGAAFAVLVDEGTEARALMRANVEALGLGGATRLLRRDATRLGAVAPFEPFGLVFLDPPYGKGLGERALASALAGGWLRPGAVIVLEEAAGVDVTWPEGVTLLDTREAGAGTVHFAVSGTEFSNP